MIGFLSMLLFFGLFKVQKGTRDINVNFGRYPSNFWAKNIIIFSRERNKKIYFTLGRDALLYLITDFF